MSGRIPQQFIDDLLERVDIVDVIEARVPLKKTGKNYSARCPFHDEKTPSFSVNPDKQFYYCFGCGAGGNALGFLMEYERLEFPAAIEKLAAIAGVEVPREGGGTNTSPRQAELAARLEQAAAWFQRQLREHPQAKVATDYLRGRGLNQETIERFGIGYAPPGWEKLLRALGANDADRKLLLDAGLVIKRDDGTLYDRFRERIMFPIRDNRGRTVAFGGRVLTDEKPKYLNSPETAIFHKSQELYGLFEARKSNRELDRMLIVEGYMDVVMLGQHGITNAAGTLGTALTGTHLQRLFRYTQALVFCFDGDDAGRRAAARALELVLPAMEDGRQASFLFLPEGEDPDSLVQRIGPDAFRETMRGAMPLPDFLFQHFGADLDLTQMDGRARLSKLALPAINRIPGTVLRELMRGALAERVGLATSQLPGAPVTRATATDNGPEPARPAPPPVMPRAQPPQRSGRHLAGSARAALRLLLHDPALARRVKDPAMVRALDDPDLPLLLQVLEYISMNPGISVGGLLGYWYGSPEGEVLTRLAAQEILPGTDTALEFDDLLAHMAQKATAATAETLRRELESIPLEQWSPAQKQQYRELMAGMARK